MNEETQVRSGAVNAADSSNQVESKQYAEQCRKRMLNWPNPVEFVNNLYGAHPGDDDTEYFQLVFEE